MKPEQAVFEANGGIAVVRWQDISTAPKDRTPVLCTWMYRLEDGSTRWSNVMHVLSYFPEWYGDGTDVEGVVRSGGAWVLDGDFNVHFEPDEYHESPPIAYGDPTHWMPLPDPPRAHQAIEGVKRDA